MIWREKADDSYMRQRAEKRTWRSTIENEHCMQEGQEGPLYIDLLISDSGLYYTDGNASAEIYLAPDAEVLCPATMHGILAPMTQSVFHGSLPHSLAPGTSERTLPYPFLSGRN